MVAQRLQRDGGVPPRVPVADHHVDVFADAFGAEAGDEVVEIHATGRPGELSARRWRMGEEDKVT